MKLEKLILFVFCYLPFGMELTVGYGEFLSNGLISFEKEAATGVVGCLCTGKLLF
jgi:hypothetical protein